MLLWHVSKLSRIKHCKEWIWHVSILTCVIMQNFPCGTSPDFHLSYWLFLTRVLINTLQSEGNYSDTCPESHVWRHNLQKFVVTHVQSHTCDSTISLLTSVHIDLCHTAPCFLWFVSPCGCAVFENFSMVHWCRFLFVLFWFLRCAMYSIIQEVLYIPPGHRG